MTASGLAGDMLEEDYCSKDTEVAEVVHKNTVEDYYRSSGEVFHYHDVQNFRSGSADRGSYFQEEE